VITHDFHCGKCGMCEEISFSSFADFVREVECACGGVAVQTWRKAPGLAGVSEPGTRGITRTFHPGTYDVQAGRVFDSRSDREKWAKSRGLIGMGPEEYKRTMDNTNEPEVKLEGFRDAMEVGWQQAKSSRGVEPLPSVDTKDVAVVGEM
jgi:hypothetical protein